MSIKKRPKQRPSGVLDPRCYYTLPAFFTEARIGRSTISRAREAGIEFPTETVGRNKYVPGDRGIEFLKALAALPKQDA